MKHTLLLGLCMIVLALPALASTDMSDTVLNMSTLGSTVTIQPTCTWHFDLMIQDASYLYVENLTVTGPLISESMTFNFTEAGTSYNCDTFPYPVSPGASISQCQVVKSQFTKFAVALFLMLGVIAAAVVVLFVVKFDGTGSAATLVYLIVTSVGIGALILGVIMLVLANMC